MSYKVKFKLGGNSDGYTISGLINKLKGKNAPTTLKFLAFLPVNRTEVGQNLGEVIILSEEESSIVATPLVTCGSLCVCNTVNTKAYVYHTGSGNLSQDTFQEILNKLEVAAADLQIAYAYPGIDESGHQATVQKLREWGVDEQNIVEIENTEIGSFGLNNYLQLGWGAPK